jgi:hypothetical protein
MPDSIIIRKDKKQTNRGQAAQDKAPKTLAAFITPWLDFMAIKLATVSFSLPFYCWYLWCFVLRDPSPSPMITTTFSSHFYLYFLHVGIQVLFYFTG